MVLLFLHSSEMLSLNMALIGTTQTYPNNPNRCVRPEPKSIRINVNTRFGPNMSLSRHPRQSSAHRKRSSQPRAPSELDQPQHDPDPLFYRDVAMADLPSQYAEEVETFRHILNLPDSRETMPRSSTSVLGLDDQKGQQELRPRGPSAMLPLSSHVKDAFDKFEQDFLASNLPEGKYIKPPPLQSGTRWDSLALKTKCKN